MALASQLRALAVPRDWRPAGARYLCLCVCGGAALRSSLLRQRERARVLCGEREEGERCGARGASERANNEADIAWRRWDGRAGRRQLSLLLFCFGVI